MREPDIAGPNGDAWKVPLDKLTEYVLAHEGDIHPSARGDVFVSTWKDVWYVRRVEANIVEDSLNAQWLAVVLRELKSGDGVIRMYEEAEWDLTAYLCDPAFGDPPVNGEALFEWQQRFEPPVMYQFHGLTEFEALALGDDPRRPVTFAQYLVEAICRGMTVGSDQTWAHRLSKMVNGIRGAGLVTMPRRPLEVAGRTGLLVELDDGSSVSLPGSVVTS